MKREEVLAEARKCVCGDRDKNYGSPENSFECIAGMWTAYLKQRGVTAAITPWDVAWMMVLLKASRAAGNTSFAKTLLTKIEENRKQRLQTERIERRKRKEASYNRRRNRGHRRNKKSKNGN